MNAPTVEQLLNLADRAERTRLTPAEVALLRVGIQLLAEQRHQDTRAIASLHDRIRDLKEQRRRATPRQLLVGTQRLETAKTLRARYETGETIQAIADDTGHSYYRTRDLLLLAGTTMRPRGGRPTTEPTRKDTT